MKAYPRAKKIAQISTAAAKTALARLGAGCGIRRIFPLKAAVVFLLSV
jgi:hypothetical protein